MRLFEAIKAENDGLYRAVVKLEDSTFGDPAARRHLFEELGSLLDGQRQLDEQFIYPLFTAAEQRDHLIERSRRELDSIGERIAALRSRATDDPDIKYEISLLSSQLREHLDHENRELLPQADSLIDDEEEARLAEQIARTHARIGRRLHGP